MNPRTPLFTLLGVAMIPSLAAAQDTSTCTSCSADFEMVRPTFTHRGLQGVRTPNGNRQGTVRYGIMAQYEKNPLTLFEFDTQLGTVVTNRNYNVLGVSVDASKDVWTALHIPFANTWGSEILQFAGDGFGVGDINAGVGVTFLRVRQFSMGAVGGLTLPTGRRNAWLGERAVRGDIGLMAMVDVGPLTVGGEATTTFKALEDTGTDYVSGSELAINGGVRYGLPAIPVALTGQVFNRSGYQAFLSGGAENSIEALGGIQLRPHRDVRIDLGAGRGLGSWGAGTTDFRLLGGVTIQHIPRWPPPPPPPPPPVKVETMVVEEIPPEDPPPEPEWEEGEIAKVVADEIKIREKLKFRVNTNLLLEESRPVLQAIADVVNTNPFIGHVVIEGHASEEGSHEFNYQLSESRARAIFQELMLVGVHPHRISYRGMGEVVPLDKGSTEEALAKNRRVEFHIVRQFQPDETDTLPTYDEKVSVPWTGDTIEIVQPPKPVAPEPEPEVDEFENAGPDNFGDFTPEEEEFEVEGTDTGDTENKNEDGNK